MIRLQPGSGVHTLSTVSPRLARSRDAFFFLFFDDDRFTQITCVTVGRYLNCTARLRSTNNYFCSSLCNILADIFSWEHGKPFWCVTELKEWEKDRSMFCSVLSCLRLTDFIKYIFPQTQPYLNLCVSTYILYKSEGEAGRQGGLHRSQQKTASICQKKYQVVSQQTFIAASQFNKSYIDEIIWRF